MSLIVVEYMTVTGCTELNRVECFVEDTVLDTLLISA